MMTDCPSWCEVDEAHGEDGHRSVRWVLPIDAADGLAIPTVYLQAKSDVARRVWLGVGESDTGFTLTAHEARELARMLVDLADLADLNDR
jgi:hypothetical protein